LFSIPDPGSEFFEPGSASNNLIILTQILVSKLSEIRSGLFIPDPDPAFYPSRITLGEKVTVSRRVVDPYSFFTDPELDGGGQYGSGSGSNTDPGFNDQKLKKNYS
jgi:hypothetical protein